MNENNEILNRLFEPDEKLLWPGKPLIEGLPKNSFIYFSLYP
ncbi:MAG: hypothetical protein ACFFD2_06075 [Promethearchaeota archaeon]